MSEQECQAPADCRKEDLLESETTSKESQLSQPSAKDDCGSAGPLSEDDTWECKSNELYDSDNPPEHPLNAYHVRSEPRLLHIQQSSGSKTQLLVIPCLQTNFTFASA